ncbi:uncharacterized protein FOMMEDRAFT_152990 [Fomitiporia mediterranea MF3/22]|uniref:uncharacterized protein n=1 Tax=Fomitiporia mediterranea (strain MF3/22) TaxID=694068 RepID=UPI0004409A0D|nr:uncharacterized protein FOMMEDRAFT_152990 [Fomitiporia mediterranea MF3/22]EJD05657.1 hypothetical protein FOMMEDRAFT_152990 [Fomitiporia mediterranea MF3/22]
MSDSLILIINPKCGDEQGPDFVDEHVIPLLSGKGIHIDRQIVTTAPGHGGLEVVNFINGHKEHSSISIILASGDGTLHEIINSVHNASFVHELQISVALVPTGTANALYSSLFSHALAGLQGGSITPIDYKLHSVKSLLNGRRNISPLTITKATVRSSANEITASSFAAVVTSTALHASILHDSESLREQVPDLSRFKLAAQKNITRWYQGTVKFRPADNGQVLVYDSHSNQFVPFVGDDNNATEPTMSGPFAYFLSTVNVDRLEPSFVISPLHSKIPSGGRTMDLIVIRPKRDPTIPKESSSEDDHTRFAKKVEQALYAAYRDGAHVGLKYSRDGQLLDGAASKSLHSLVEYIRFTGSWRWINTGTEIAHLCVDGAIFDIETGGEAECQVIDSKVLRFGIFV